MKESKGLRVFVRDGCANYSKHRETCLFADSCKVMSGQRCSYFVKAVLWPPDYPHKIPGYDYAKLFGQYWAKNGGRHKGPDNGRANRATHNDKFAG